MEDAKIPFPKESVCSRAVYCLRKTIDSCRDYLLAFAKAVKYCRADAVLVEGKEIHSGQSMKVFYFGTYRNYIWLAHTIFSEFAIKEITKNIFIFNAAKWIRKYEKESDLAFLDLGYIYSKIIKKRKPDYICIPDWIGQRREIGNSRQDLSSAFRKHNKLNYINRITKHSITYRMVSAEEDFKDFYQNYYVAYASKRFGETSMTDTEEVFLRQCRNGEVMQILHENEVIAYSLFGFERDELSSVLFGIAQNIDDEISKIVFNAIYYYAIIYGFDKGYNTINFGMARPLLNNGVYIYKRRWGGNVYPYSDFKGNMFFRPSNFKEPIIKIFSSNYFVTKNNNKLIAKIVCGEEELSVHFIEHVLKNYYSEGIDVLRIYSMKEVSPEIAAWSRENAPPVEIVDLSGERDPQKVFCM